MKNAIKIEIRPSGTWGWYWRMIASNGKILCHSENINNRNDCYDIVLRIVKCKNWKIKLYARIKK